MPSINEVTLLGHLGADPEIRSTQSGTRIANLRLATSYKPREGQEQTEWHRVTCFKAMADQVANCRKGDLVFAKGRIQTRKWQDSNGQDRYTTEVVANIAVAASWHKRDQPSQPSVDPLDADIPF